MHHVRLLVFVCAVSSLKPFYQVSVYGGSAEQTLTCPNNTVISFGFTFSTSSSESGCMVNANRLCSFGETSCTKIECATGGWTYSMIYLACQRPEDIMWTSEQVLFDHSQNVAAQVTCPSGDLVLFGFTWGSTSSNTNTNGKTCLKKQLMRCDGGSVCASTTCSLTTTEHAYVLAVCQPAPLPTDVALVYNEDEHRAGVTCPAGMTVAAGVRLHTIGVNDGGTNACMREGGHLRACDTGLTGCVEDENCDVSSVEWEMAYAMCEVVCPGILPDVDYSDGSHIACSTQGVPSRQSCALHCVDGYYPTGVFDCDHGNWSDPFPSCQAATCPSLAPVNGNSGTCDGTQTTEQQCSIECSPGYYVVGGMQTCLGNGPASAYPDLQHCQDCVTIDFSSVLSVESESCTACNGPAVTNCQIATCAAGYYGYAAGACDPCADFSSTPSVVEGSCVTCAGPSPVQCSNASCASGYSQFAGGTCKADCAVPVVAGGTWSCNDSVPHGETCSFVADDGFTCVEEGMRVCTNGAWDAYPACGGDCAVPHVIGGAWTGAPGCATASTVITDSTCTFAPLGGYHCVRVGPRTCNSSVWDVATPSCQPCSSAVDFSLDSSVVAGTCATCSGPTPGECATATCADGYHSYSAGTCAVCAATVDFSAVASVQTGTCTRCTGALPSQCSQALCSPGYYDYGAGLCQDCATVSFASLSPASVVLGSCTVCSGALATQCQAATCAVGFHSFSNGECQGCSLVDFSAVAAVVDGTCSACTGGVRQQCTLAICSEGYNSYTSGTCQVDKCTLESELPNRLNSCVRDSVFGTECVWSCVAGFSGPLSTRTCGAGGAWSGSFGECTGDECIVPDLAGGVWQNCTPGDALPEGSTCVFATSPGFVCTFAGQRRCLGRAFDGVPTCTVLQDDPAAIAAADDSGGGSSGGVIAALITFIVVVCLAITAYLLVFLNSKQKKRSRKSFYDDDGTATVSLDQKSSLSTMITTMLDAKSTRVIGHGATAVVSKAQLPATGDWVALKVLRSSNVTEEQHLQFHHEVNILSKLMMTGHPNIIGLRMFCSDPSAIVMDLAEGGTLHDVTVKAGVTDTAVNAPLLAQVADGLAFLHSNRIAHNDIKGQNVMIGANNIPKITDFGTALEADEPLTVGDFNGTVKYAAPERFRVGIVVDFLRSDVYSFGVMAYVVFSGTDPLVSLVPDTLIESIRFAPASDYRGLLTNEFPPIEGLDGGIMSTITRCLSGDPASRPYASSLAQDFSPDATVKVSSLSTDGLVSSSTLAAAHHDSARADGALGSLSVAQTTSLSESEPHLASEAEAPAQASSPPVV